MTDAEILTVKELAAYLKKQLIALHLKGDYLASKWEEHGDFVRAKSISGQKSKVVRLEVINQSEQ